MSKSRNEITVPYFGTVNGERVTRAFLRAGENELYVTFMIVNRHFPYGNSGSSTMAIYSFKDYPHLKTIWDETFGWNHLEIYSFLQWVGLLNHLKEKPHALSRPTD